MTRWGPQLGLNCWQQANPDKNLSSSVLIRQNLIGLVPSMVRPRPHAHAHAHAQAIKAQNGHLHYKTDIWSLACTVIEMVTALPPWHSKGFTNSWAAMFHIAQSECGPPFPPTLSQQCQDIIVR